MEIPFDSSESALSSNNFDEYNISITQENKMKPIVLQNQQNKSPVCMHYKWSFNSVWEMAPNRRVCQQTAFTYSVWTWKRSSLNLL